jgi:hypothetical protein
MPAAEQENSTNTNPSDSNQQD